MSCQYAGMLTHTISQLGRFHGQPRTTDVEVEGVHAVRTVFECSQGIGSAVQAWLQMMINRNDQEKDRW